jgi:hypothetical protein
MEEGQGFYPQAFRGCPRTGTEPRSKGKAPLLAEISTR